MHPRLFGRLRVNPQFQRLGVKMNHLAGPEAISFTGWQVEHGLFEKNEPVEHRLPRRWRTNVPRHEDRHATWCPLTELEWKDRRLEVSPISLHKGNLLNPCIAGQILGSTQDNWEPGSQEGLGKI
jgi:hypothetical protein